jgi:tetratricopeptide (TPR) repeat protein/transcriptional regulator with XRE-family HTH domain
MSADLPDEKAAGTFLRRARQAAGLTQEELAARTGLSVRAIGDLERGLTTKPHRRSLELLAEVLELPERARAQLMGASRRLDTPDIAEAPRVPRSGRQFAPAQLPTDIPDFTGRASHVNELCRLLSGRGPEWLRSGAVRIALVVGAGGLGKTALAVHTAHLLASEFPDGQLYANLHGVTQPAEPAEILARFLRALGAEPAHIPVGEEERAAYYRTRLDGKRVLIVLDDARAADQVRPLLPGSAACAVLVTSRASMPELVESKVLDLDVLSHNEARTLFALVAGQERALAEPEATDDVLAACAGLPLAIRIGGARLAARGSWTVRTLADRLADERKRLDVLRAGNLAVRASFEVSFASLARPEAPGEVDPTRAFRMLGLWTGSSVSLPAAAALLGEDEDAVADALDVLADAHLLELRAPDRYRFHDLLRVYAADRARNQETEQDRAAAITRLLTWYLHTTEATARVISAHHARVPLDSPSAAVEPLQFASLEQALAWCEQERAGLMAAVRLAAASGLHEIAWKLPAAAMSFYYRRSYWGDWVATHEVGLESARATGDRLGEAWMLNSLGMAYGVQHMEESVSCFEQALTIYRELGDEQGEARAANNVAQAYVDLGRFADALSAAQRSLAIQRLKGNRYLEGVALGILGRACRELGQFAEAIAHLAEALAIFRELGQQYGEADSLTDMGDTFLGLGQVETAIARLRESLAIRREIGDVHGEAVTLRLLGLAVARTGDHAQAHDLITEAVRLFEDRGDQAEAAAARTALATIAEPQN